MSTIRELAWPIGDPRPEMWILDRAALFSQIGSAHLGELERLNFHLIIHCTSGTGTHTVDFESVELRPNRALYIHPGQVHQWDPAASYEAKAVVFPLAPAWWPLTPVGATVVELDTDQRQKIDLLYEIGAMPNEAVKEREQAALRDLLYIAFGFAQKSDGTRDGQDYSLASLQAFDALRHDIEGNLVAGQTVQQRAERLGYSTRTLDRACKKIAGMSAKQMIDQRLSFEARRLLALAGSKPTAISAALGFTELSNFTKFMKRTTGRPPSELSSSQRVHSDSVR